MNCRGVSRRLSAFIDNDLSPGIRDAVEEHLQKCIPCKRRYSELEAIVTAARALGHFKAPDGFTEKVVQAVVVRRQMHGFVGSLRYKLVVAGVAFTGAAAIIFLVIGPPSSRVPTTLGGTQSQPAVTTSSEPDFYSNPEIKLKSFPIPEVASNRDLANGDSLLASDSTSRIDEFVLPEVQKVKENVNAKF